MGDITNKKIFIFKCEDEDLSDLLEEWEFGE